MAVRCRSGRVHRTNYDSDARSSPTCSRAALTSCPFPPLTSAPEAQGDARDPHRQDPTAAGAASFYMNQATPELAQLGRARPQPVPGPAGAPRPLSGDRHRAAAARGGVETWTTCRSAYLLPSGINGYAPELDRRLPYDPAAARASLAGGRLSERLQGAAGRLGRQRPRRLLRVPGRHARRGRHPGRAGARAGMHGDKHPAREPHGRSPLREQHRHLALFRSTISRSVYHGVGNRSIYASGYSSPEIDALLDAIDGEMSTYVGLVQDTCKKWSQASRRPSTALRPARCSFADTDGATP